MNYSFSARPVMTLFWYLLIGITFAACSSSTTNNGDNNEPPPVSTTDVTITIDNVGASAWEVTNVEGDEDAAEENQNNTTITLEENLRYHFINNGGATAHPFGLQDSNDAYLLAQGDQSGTFESDTAVDFESDNEGIIFTLTPELAEELATYNCQIHVSMEGTITIR